MNARKLGVVMTAVVACAALLGGVAPAGTRADGSTFVLTSFDGTTLTAVNDQNHSFIAEFGSTTAFKPAALDKYMPSDPYETACAAVVCASLAPLASGSAAGTLTLIMQVAIADDFRTCPPGTPAEATGCFSRKGTADVHGLGRVEESWDPVVDETGAGCGPASLRFFPSTARFTVSGKGAIDVQVNGACLPFFPPSPVEGTETFTVTGGSGKFAGASGAGTVDHLSNGPGLRGHDTWSGTVVVPGFEFDLTPPTITGAADIGVRASRKAKRIRVRYHVSASDDVDGAVPLACQPKSGSFFRVGRSTVVRCSATDTSANTQRAQFTITVQPIRRLATHRARRDSPRVLFLASSLRRRPTPPVATRGREASLG